MRIAGAVDIGGTSTKIGIVREDGEILHRTTVATAPEGEPGPLVDAISAELSSMIGAMGPSSPLAGVGVSVAGFLDREHSAMIQNANLPALMGFSLRSALESRLSLECRLEVDSNAAAVAEFRFGAGRGSTRLLGVTVGTGLGCAVIIDGKLLRFTGECVGDPGHIILDPNGRACTCGARGCFEAMVNSASVSDRGGGRSPRDIVNAARNGESEALKALTETASWLGLGLASLFPIFQPDRIVVGGGIAAAGQLLLDPTRDSFRKHGSPDCSQIALVGSELDGWEGMVGAGNLFLNPQV
ncbi:MAG: ROK family protein [Gemmatimonadaceae bacterium]